MPAHVVVGHLAVIVAPVAVLLALLYAVRPGARRSLRWPLVGATAATLGLVVWAGEVGGQLLDALEAGGTLPASVDQHAHGSDAMAVAAFVLAVAVAALVPRLLAPGRPGASRRTVAAGALAVCALALAATTATTLAQAMTAVWAQHPGWPA